MRNKELKTGSIALPEQEQIVVGIAEEIDPTDAGAMNAIPTPKEEGQEQTAAGESCTQKASWT